MQISVWQKLIKGIISNILGIAIIFITVSYTSPALGFTLPNSLNNNTPNDTTDDLQAAARWNNIPGSLINQKVRGLDGGIEYAIASDFCDRIIPRFIDNPKPSCKQIQQAIQQTFEQWAQGHPILKFVNVTSQISPQLPPPGAADPWRGFGAEIDIFALNSEEYPQVENFGAYTTFWYRYNKPIGTNNRELSGSTITSSDIVFNLNACYHFNPQLENRNCNHFSSLLLHEIGHAFALSHPNQYVERNFDTDDNPSNKISINCQDPTRGFKLSPNIDPQAVMNSSLRKPEPVHSSLSFDDLGGRDFLYPSCSNVKNSGKSSISIWTENTLIFITFSIVGFIVFLGRHRIKSYLIRR